MRAVPPDQAKTYCSLALRDDVSLATFVRRRLFPASKAEPIRGLVARDLPFYDAPLSRHAIASRSFATEEDVVALEF